MYFIISCLCGGSIELAAVALAASVVAVIGHVVAWVYNRLR